MKTIIPHDLTTCNFCESLDVMWEIEINIPELLINRFCVCDYCVEYIPYLIDVIDWDDISIKTFPETPMNKLPYSDYYCFMRERATKKLLERKE